MTKLLLKYLVPIETEQLSHCQAFMSLCACRVRPSHMIPDNGQQHPWICAPRNVACPWTAFRLLSLCRVSKRDASSDQLGSYYSLEVSLLIYTFLPDTVIRFKILKFSNKQNTEQTFLHATGYYSTSSVTHLQKSTCQDRGCPRNEITADHEQPARWRCSQTFRKKSS